MQKILLSVLFFNLTTSFIYSSVKNMQDSDDSSKSIHRERKLTPLHVPELKFKRVGCKCLMGLASCMGMVSGNEFMFPAKDTEGVGRFCASILFFGSCGCFAFAYKKMIEVNRNLDSIENANSLV